MMTNYKNKELEKLQQHSYYILKAFANLAEEHDLKYSLGFGTLIGAIRHEGFIPWDDDVDVLMPRKDYERFLKIAKEELPDEFFLQNHLTDKENFHFFSRICLEDTLALQSHYKLINNHKGIFIDIFPMDTIAPESKQEAHAKKLLMLKRLKRIPSDNPSFLDKLLMSITKVFPSILSYQNINIKLDQEAQKYNGLDTGYLYASGDATALTSKGEFFYAVYKIPNYSFDKLIKHKFEYEEFSIFENYDQVLSMQYGDYMALPNKEDQNPHHGFLKFEFREDLDSNL